VQVTVNQGQSQQVHRNTRGRVVVAESTRTDKVVRVGGGNLTGLVLLARAPLMKAALTLDMPTPNPRARNAATTPKRDHAIEDENHNNQHGGARINK
jgi:hypothetical protein